MCILVCITFPVCDNSYPMGRILVIYDSQTGNTEKMAKLVAEGAKKFPVEVRLKS